MTAIVALQMETCFVSFLGIVHLTFLLQYYSNLKLTVNSKYDQMLAFVIIIGNIFDDRGEITGRCYCKFPLQSLVKINKRQSALHVNGTTTGGLSS